MRLQIRGYPREIRGTLPLGRARQPCAAMRRARATVGSSTGTPMSSCA
jgi:hypothetical protein